MRQTVGMIVLAAALLSLTACWPPGPSTEETGTSPDGPVIETWQKGDPQDGSSDRIPKGDPKDPGPMAGKPDGGGKGASEGTDEASRNGDLSVLFPSTLSVELKNDEQPGLDSQPASWPPAVVAALIAAVAALLGALANYLFSRRLSDRARANQEQVEVLKAQLASAANERQQQHAARLAELDRDHRQGIEDRRLDLAREDLRHRTGASGLELELAATRLVDDRRFREAEAVSLYFDHLLSPDERARDMALFALSNLVDTETLAALLAGGDTFLSRVSLSKLASQRDDAIGRAAQKILNSDSSALRPSVFQVSRADMGRAQATGFLCAQPDLVVTYAIADPKAAVSVIDADGEHLSGKAILVDRRTGLLAIQLDQPLKGAHPLLISDRFNLESEPGTTVSALTWVPGSTFRARTGVLSRTDLRGLTIMGLTSGGDGPLPFNEFRIPVEPGVAGAPILNRSDEVCGVVVAGTQDGSISYSPNPEAIAGFVNHALEMCAPASRRRSHQRTRQ